MAAIDFGTTYSGWGYALRDDFVTDPSKVTVKHWNSGNIISYKAPTCILLTPDGENVEAFGYDAETKYSALIQENKHNDYYFFNRFKMELHKSLEQVLHIKQLKLKSLCLLLFENCAFVS